MERFEEFLTERKYLKNVSEQTLLYYRNAFRSREVSPVSINRYICALNAYWRWTGIGLKVGGTEGPCHADAPINQALVSFKPKGIHQIRTHAAACSFSMGVSDQ